MEDKGSQESSEESLRILQSELLTGRYLFPPSLPPSLPPLPSLSLPPSLSLSLSSSLPLSFSSSLPLSLPLSLFAYQKIPKFICFVLQCTCACITLTCAFERFAVIMNTVGIMTIIIFNFICRLYKSKREFTPLTDTGNVHILLE